MAKFFIKHITKYSYSSPVIDGATLIRLHPVQDDYQKVSSHLLSVNTNPHIETFTDAYNNRIGTFMVTEPHEILNIESEIEVTTINRLFPDDSVDNESQWKELNIISKKRDFIDFLEIKPFSGIKEVTKLIETKKLRLKSPFQAALDLSEYIYKNFTYKKGITTIDTDLNEIWALKAGVCQDFTTILLQIVKQLGIPSRYVSGYICPNDDITRGEGATHAWIEVYIPFYGWLGIDPTNNAIANENHVRLAVGRDFTDCSPVKGVFKGNAEAKLDVRVEVKTDKTEEVFSSSVETSYSETRNSYKRNLELQQQYMQQQ